MTAEIGSELGPTDKMQARRQLAIFVQSGQHDKTITDLTPHHTISVTPDLSPYSLHPSYAHWSAMLNSLEERTGKNMTQWLAALKRAKAATPAECRAFLKDRNLGAATIGLILDQMAGKTPESYDPKAMVAEMFTGPKEALLPLYEAVLMFTLGIGSDVKACPCATMVPFYRKHVFAQIKPATRSRLDLGLALGGLKVSGLIDTGGLARKDRITHRLELSAAADFNESAKEWLRRAYNADF